MEIHRHPALARMWALVGTQPEVPAPGKNEKQVVYGGVNYATGRITYANAGAERLIAHLAETRRILTRGGAAGKRLDFLMQELNREANTLGSKSVDAELSHASLELKVLIEQMREQVQNLE